MALPRYLVGFWSALAAWSVLCMTLSQSRFTHVLFICEQVEALYRGGADDTIVMRVMQTLIAVVWTTGAAAIVLCWQVFGIRRDGPRK